MTDPNVSAAPRTAYALFGVSAALLAFQLWIVALWRIAFNTSYNQGERVQYYLAHLPFGLGRYGTFNVTWVSAGVGLVALITALVAARSLRDPWRPLAFTLAGANALLILWYLFTLM